MFLTMFFKTQNIGHTMHLTMLSAHPYGRQAWACRIVIVNLSWARRGLDPPDSGQSHTDLRRS